MTLTNEEIKEVGLAVTEALAFEGSEAQEIIEGLLAPLNREDLIDLIVASNEVIVNAVSSKVDFRNWMAETVEEVGQVAPNTNVFKVLVAVQFAAEMTLG